MVIINAMNVKIFDKRLAEKNKTQKEMAEDLNMRESRISDMKSDRIKGYRYRYRMAQYLDVPIAEVFPDEEQPKKKPHPRAKGG